jgi:hypothetical protein
MIEVQRSVRQKFWQSDISHPVVWVIFSVFISLLVHACNTDKYQSTGQVARARFLYELKISTTEAYSQIVDLHQAQIRINGKEQTRIAFIAGTRIIEVPLNCIQKIRFSTLGPISPYAGTTQPRGKFRIRMEIFAEGETGQPNAVSITCDSIPDFYIIGQESRYVKRIFRNNTENFDISEIQFLQITDLAAKPQSPESEKPDTKLQ